VLVVPDLGNVEVLHDGQAVGRTDDQGRILVPSLRPFEDNTLTIVPEDVPVGAMIDSDRISVRPYSHGIVTAVMSVAASQSQVFQLLLAPGIYVPPGAEIQLNGHSFPVGTEGLAQVPLAHAAADGMVNWPGGRCKLHVPAAGGVKAGTGDPIVTTCGKP
jgi:outer membrane usher protein